MGERIGKSEITDLIRHMFQSEISHQDFATWNDERIQIRSYDDKIGFNLMEGHHSVEDDILFFKLAEAGIVRVRLYSLSYGRDLPSGKKICALLDKYAVRSDYVSTTETGNSEVDMHALITAGEIENLLSLTETLIGESIEEDEYFEGDGVFFMEVDIKFSEFLERVTNYLSEGSLQHREEAKGVLIERMNQKIKYAGDELEIRFSLKEFFDTYPHIYGMLRHLEGTGKIDIEGIEITEDRQVKLGVWEPATVILSLKSNVSMFRPEFSYTIEPPKKTKKDVELNGFALSIRGMDFQLEAGGRTASYIKLIVDCRSDERKEVTFEDMAETYAKNPLNYKGIGINDFKAETARTLLKSKGYLIGSALRGNMKTFFRVSKDRVTMPF